MTREDLIALATAFRDEAAADLAKAQSAGEIHAVTLQSYERLHALESQLFTDYAVKVDCKAGCGTCCHLAKVDARAHEIFAFVAWINAHFSPEQRSALQQRATAHAEAVAGLTLEQHLRTVRACPLLVDMRCSAHPARPAICRIGHSTDVRICERAYANPQDLEARSGYHAESKLALTVAADGTTFAFVELGMDRTTYDLGSALAEALASREPEERWLRGERAFSDRAVARQEREGQHS